jgi:hypothetical protein
MNNQPTEILSTSTRIDLTFSKADSLEADNMALWFSGSLTTPDSLKYFLLYNLNYLRYYFSDSISIDSNITYDLRRQFHEPWVIGEILVKYNDSAASQILNGTYKGWELLDSSLLPDRGLNQVDELRWAYYRFNKRYNPQLLAHIYMALPGVVTAEPNALAYEWGFELFPGIANGEMTYLFKRSGPRYYYFRYINGKPKFIGLWQWNMDPQPDWYSMALANIDSFETWNGYRH